MATQQQVQHPQKPQGNRGLPWKRVRRIIYILVIITLLFFIAGGTTWVLIQVGIIKASWSDRLFTILTGLGGATAVLLAIFSIFQFILSLIPSVPELPVIASPPAAIQQLDRHTDTSPKDSHQEPLLLNFPRRRNQYFTGREALLERLHDQFNQTTTLALTQTQAIHGLGGIGKTQIALEYAYRYSHDYRHLLWM
jgi:hypothetical protein